MYLFIIINSIIDIGVPVSKSNLRVMCMNSFVNFNELYTGNIFSSKLLGYILCLRIKRDILFSLSYKRVQRGKSGFNRVLFVLL